MRVLISFLLLSFSSLVLAEHKYLTDQDAFYHYEALAELRTPKKELLKLISEDYRKARDEFTRHDLANEYWPTITAKIDALKKSERKILIRTSERIGEYDFDKNAFSLDVSTGTYFPYGRSHAAMFTNADKLSTLTVPMAKARQFSELLADSRKVRVEFFGRTVSAEERKFGMSTKKTISIKVDKLVVTHAESKKVIAEVNL